MFYYNPLAWLGLSVTPAFYTETTKAYDSAEKNKDGTANANFKKYMHSLTYSQFTMEMKASFNLIRKYSLALSYTPTLFSSTKLGEKEAAKGDISHSFAIALNANDIWKDGNKSWSFGMKTTLTPKNFVRIDFTNVVKL